MPDSSARFRLLHDLGCAFAEQLELDELIPLVVAKCRETLDAEGVAVLESGDALRVDDARADPRFYGDIDRCTELCMGCSMCTWIWY